MTGYRLFWLLFILKLLIYNNNRLILLIVIKKEGDSYMSIEKKDKDIHVSESVIIDALMNHLIDYVYFKDLKGRYLILNNSNLKKIGAACLDEAIGKTDFDYFSEGFAKEVFNNEQKIIKTGIAQTNVEHKEKLKGGETRWASNTIIPLCNKEGKIIGIFGISRDITDKKIAEERVEYLSFHDSLTGLYNRAYFDEELIRLDTDRQLPIAIVMGDVNGLKVINDVYGHKKGDIFLKRIAVILKECFRKEDIVSRWGGDEFVVILPRTSDDSAKKIIKRIKDLCDRRSNLEIPLSISIGVSTKRSQSENINVVLKEAEADMYRDKKSGHKSSSEKIVNALKERLKTSGYDNEGYMDKLYEYADDIGKKLKLSKIKLEELRLLLSVYDIGKIAVVDEIISKPRKLDREEWETIKQLPRVGYRIAESSDILKPLAEPILSHYE